MKKLSNLLLAALAAIFLLTLVSLKTDNPSPEIQQQDTLAAKRAVYVKQLREAIKGKETLPADSVFKNIKSLKGIPAGRLLAIMNFGYARSLGVNCTHCHNTTKWESDEKPQKQIARDMSSMVGQTNQLIKNIKNLKSVDPVVNCTTCHRGAIKPALDLP